MTELALAGSDSADPPPRGRGRRRLLMLALPLLLAGAGFASTYLGYWSPLALTGLGGGAPAQAAPGEPATAFVDLPAINVTLPDARPRLLHLVAKLEVPAEQAKAVERLLPRVLDAFNTFLTGIAPEAFERRGILEIMREELKTRVQLALKTDAPVEVLIMEFALK